MTEDSGDAPRPTREQVLAARKTFELTGMQKELAGLAQEIMSQAASQAPLAARREAMESFVLLAGRAVDLEDELHRDVLGFEDPHAVIAVEEWRANGQRFRELLAVMEPLLMELRNIEPGSG